MQLHKQEGEIDGFCIVMAGLQMDQAAKVPSNQELLREKLMKSRQSQKAAWNVGHEGFHRKKMSRSI